jgi:hypothetical protein
MSLPKETLIDLMALADGELEGDALEQAERLMAGSDEARLIVEAMRAPGLGALLDEVMTERAGAADGIADAVMGKLAQAGQAGASEEGGVVRLADARARGRRTGPRTQLVAGALTALALAAGVAIYVRSNQDSGDLHSPVASVGNPAVDMQPPPSTLAQAARPRQDVEVDQVESPHDITVFSIPLGGAAAAAANPANPSSVVIMIEDDPGPQ